MAQYNVHADISTQLFPYNFYELSSTTLVTKSLEQDASGTIKGEPQAYYMDNVLPLSRGYSSVGFTDKVPVVSEDAHIRGSFPIYGEGGKIALFEYNDTNAWVFDPSGGIWVELELPTAGLQDVTYGTVREVTYIHLGVGLYRYNFVTQELELVDIPSLPGVGGTLGVCSAGSQLVLWDNTSLYFSSVEDPLDFTPSIDTGAGTTKIQQLRGRIVACISLGKNFIIYSDVNAVSARWTDNLAFPYRFMAIANSAGINTIKHVAINSNTGLHIVWTRSGFQQVTIEEAQYIWPELSDGIIRGLLLRVNPIFNMPSLVRASNLDVSISFVSNRYIAISVKDLSPEAEDVFYDAYVYDTSLQRWGKLSVPHADFVEYVVPEVFDPYTYDDLEEDYSTYGEMTSLGLSYRALVPSNSREAVQTGSNLGIVLPNGEVKTISYWETADFRGTDGSEIDAAPCRLFLGKYKLVREEGITTQWLKLNRLFDAKLTWWGHLYNGDFASKKVLEFENPEQPGQWFGMESADSISLDITGQFKLTSLEICFANAGSINQKRITIEEDVTFTTEVFSEPDYDYATSWLYSPFAMDSVSPETAVEGGIRLQEQPEYMESISGYSNIVGNISLDSIIIELDPYTDNIENYFDIVGSVTLESIIVELEPIMDEVQNYSDIAGSISLQTVVISHDVSTENITTYSDIVGTATLE